MSTQQQLPAGPAFRPLSGEELDQVSGGMKWDRGHRSPNVIDARGGQFSVGPFTWTLDINGNLSSFEVD